VNKNETKDAKQYIRELPMDEGQWGRLVEVELTTGHKLTVRSVPPYLVDRATAKIVLPDPPVRIIKSQLPGGGEERLLDEQDPEYILAVNRTREERTVVTTELFWAYGITNVDPPEDDAWKREVEEYIPDIKWRAGKLGRKLDFLQFAVITAQEDMLRIQGAIMDLTRPSPELVAEQMRIFRDQIPGEGTEELEQPQERD